VTLNPGANPYALFTGLDGRPLNNGRVYIGVAGQDPETNPQPIFWDADGNVSANNPMQTQAGYIWNAGGPARFWTQDNAYSIRARDSLGRQVFYERNVSFELPAGIVTSSAIADGAVTAPKLSDEAVTTPKLGTDVIARFAALETRASNLEAYDAEYAVIDAPTTVTVGAGGDYSTLDDAWAWVSKHRIIDQGFVTMRLLAGELTVTATSYRHPDVMRIAIEGPDLNGAVPTAAEMTADHAANIALIKSRYPSVINLEGNTDTKSGILFPGGIGTLSKIAFISNTATCRYSLVFGEWYASYRDAEGSASANIDRIALYGGVWGIWAINAYIANSSKCFLGGQQSDGSTPAGAPIGLNYSVYRGDILGTTDLQLFAPDCQYGLYEVNSEVYADNSLTVRGLSGALVERAVYCRGGFLSATSANFAFADSVCIAEREAFVEMSSPAITSSAASNTKGVFEVYQGNNAPSDALFCLGQSVTANFSGASITDSSGAWLMRSYTGATVGFLNVVCNNFAGSSGLVLASGRVYAEAKISGTFTGPGLVQAQNGTYIVATGSIGVTYSPTANTIGTDQSFIKV